jgi:hypothetical protein
MTYEELTIINFGTPSIELLNKFIKEQEGISIFYKFQYDKTKKHYWLGKMGESSKKKIGAIELGKKIYGKNFQENEMGLTESEKQECIEWNKTNI